MIHKGYLEVRTDSIAMIFEKVCLSAVGDLAYMTLLGYSRLQFT